eukprot:4202255-Pyramimonas_sp.AAC.1
MITAEGSAMEINASVTKTRLYHNLTENASVMGFCDVKNAKLCRAFEGQGLARREPALGEQDFTRYLKSLEPLMVGGRDVLWVLTGRAQWNLPKIQTILVANKFRAVTCHLAYNTKQMQ